MNPGRFSRLSRIFPVFIYALTASSFAHAATDDAAQRQLREDRERFQREVERQRTEAQTQTERARQSTEQQRTADELTRLRAQQDRQASEIRSLNETSRTRTSAPAFLPSPRIATPSSVADAPATSVATITPDFSVTFLADGNCVVYIKGNPAEVCSAVEAEKAFRSLLDTKSKPSQRSATAP